ncbi:MAG TPA: DEAD/DEAH box helicase family protein, partial [Thermoanaerobaculia bacterium]|nr:DEAD/DEAH box helicase family protein [Thermoanaerobaculia bacterium]
TPSLTGGGYKTGYLWEEIWAQDSVLNLIQHFVHRVQPPGEAGSRNGAQVQLFPRYHQVRAVRRLVAHARKHGPGQHYLFQHSAGSGKSFTIAWLAHWLSVLHDDHDRRVFDSIVVITDRRVLDQQLQETVRQFEQTLGVVENIDTTSKQLKHALEEGKTIIVTTLQKFPVIVGNVRELTGKRFALIVDEAHSSQSGETTKALKSVLAGKSLEEAEAEEAREEAAEEDTEDLVVAEMRKRGRLPNASTFAFTATPKQKTLELFGTQRPDGEFRPFDDYTMRQAIDEGFILDVLENYTTFQTYWKLLKTIEDDPRYDKPKAKSLLRSFVDLHDHAIRKKVEILVEHFREHVAHRIGGRAKAMVVTRSRLHCVRCHRVLTAYLKEKGYPFKSLVAFSGEVEDEGDRFTEGRLNGFPDSQTKAAFERPEYRFLVVAEKFQTGFDQPLLHTMYVDKKLTGVNAVQTLSRLNRTHPEKRETMVLDFANEASAIQEAFEPYYETTILSEATDPNVLYERQHELDELAVFTEEDVNAFAVLYFGHKPQDRLYRALDPVKERAESRLREDELRDFRAVLDDYARQYAFLSQVIPFTDPDLEKLYVFARYLRRYLKAPELELPRDVQEKIDMESLRVQRTFSGDLRLERGAGTLAPLGDRAGRDVSEAEVEPLSRIIQELNERYGANLGPEDRITLGRILDRAE